jgi:hypothetical protein
MGGHEVEHREERLAGASAAPVRCGRTFVPTDADELRFVAQIVIGLHVVRAVVTRGAQVTRKRAELCRHGELGPQSLGAERGSIHSGDQAGARGRADGRGGEGAGEAHRLGGEGIEPRRARLRIAIATELRTHVLGRQPQNVRGMCPGGSMGGERQQRKDQPSHQRETSEIHAWTMTMNRSHANPEEIRRNILTQRRQARQGGDRPAFAGSASLRSKAVPSCVAYATWNRYPRLSSFRCWLHRRVVTWDIGRSSCCCGLRELCGRTADTSMVGI